MMLSRSLCRPRFASLLAAACMVAGASTAKAGFVFDGIVEHACFTRADLGGGLEAITVTIGVGTTGFDTLDGGFAPLGDIQFNQIAIDGEPDATPGRRDFTRGDVSVLDTTFLLPRDFGVPNLDGPNVDTEFELSTTSIGYQTPISGSFELARLVVPIGAGVSVADMMGAVTAESVSFIREGVVVGTLSGAVASVPEAGAIAFWSALTGCLLTARSRGDYNGDGRVDAADYTVWRDSLGSTTDLAADGNDDQAVGEGDYAVWSEGYGVATGDQAQSTPEPSTLASLLAGLLGCLRRRGV